MKGHWTGNSLHVSGYPAEDISSEDLREEFARFGKIVDVYLPRDYVSRRPRGFAYVEFDDGEDARDALHALHGKEVFGGGRKVQVNRASGRRKTSKEMRLQSSGSKRSLDNRSDLDKGRGGLSRRKRRRCSCGCHDRSESYRSSYRSSSISSDRSRSRSRSSSRSLSSEEKHDTSSTKN